MSDNVYSVKDFLDTPNFDSYGDNVRVTLERLMQIVNSEGIDFVIKIGKSESNETINFSHSTKPSVNLCIIYIYQEHIRVKLANGNKVNIYDPEEIHGDGDLIFNLLDRYHEVNRGKRKFSIYIHSDLLDKIEAIAIRSNKKANEIIEQFLDEKTTGLFMGVRHKIEFRNFLMQANMFREDLDYSEQKTLKRLSFMYLIAAYQEYYKRDEGEKFKIVSNNDNQRIEGPVHLFDEWELGNSDSETILGFALSILSGSKSLSDFQDIIQDMNETTFRLAVNSLKILKCEYIVNVESENILIEQLRVLNTDGIW